MPCPECRGGKSPSPAPPSPVDRAAMVAEAEGCEANYARFSNLDLRFRKDLGLRCAAHVKALAAECGRLEAEAGRLRAAAEERDKLIDYLVYPVPDADDPKEWAAGCGRAWRSVGFSQGYPDRARAVAAVRRAAGLDAADAPAAKEDR